jgi:hypothetical protein
MILNIVILHMIIKINLIWHHAIDLFIFGTNMKIHSH